MRQRPYWNVLYIYNALSHSIRKSWTLTEPLKSRSTRRSTKRLTLGLWSRKRSLEKVCIPLGKPDLEELCTLYKRIVGVQAAVVQLAEADIRCLLRLRNLWVGCVTWSIREHAEVARYYHCRGSSNVLRGCTHPSRNDAWWRCGDLTHRDWKWPLKRPRLCWSQTGGLFSNQKLFLEKTKSCERRASSTRECS